MVRWWKHFCLNDKKKLQFCNLDGRSDYHVADIITPTITDTKPSLLYFILFLFFWVLHLFLMICLSGLWKKMKKNEKNVLFLYFCLFSLKENARKKNIFPITVKNLFIGRWEWQYINLFFLANVIRKKKNCFWIFLSTQFNCMAGMDIVSYICILADIVLRPRGVAI